MRKRGSILRKGIFYAVLVLSGLFSVWPASIMIEEGFGIDISPLFSGQGIRFVGGVPFYSGGIFVTPVHYIDELAVNGFPRLVINSTTIALLSIAITLLIATPAGYALARLRIKGRRALAFMVLALRTVSPFAVILPLYLLYVHNGLWDTYLGMGVAYLIVALPVAIWLLRGFFADVPVETYQAAELFGASEAQIFRKIALPLILPGVVVTAVFALALIWNEFLIASVLTGPATQTVSVGVWSGAGESVAFRTISWEDLNAAGALAFIPAIIMFLLIKRYLARGFSLATAR